MLMWRKFKKKYYFNTIIFIYSRKEVKAKKEKAQKDAERHRKKYEERMKKEREKEEKRIKKVEKEYLGGLKLDVDTLIPTSISPK